MPQDLLDFSQHGELVGDLPDFSAHGEPLEWEGTKPGEPLLKELLTKEFPKEAAVNPTGDTLIQFPGEQEFYSGGAMEKAKIPYNPAGVPLRYKLEGGEWHPEGHAVPYDPGRETKEIGGFKQGPVSAAAEGLSNLGKAIPAVLADIGTGESVFQGGESPNTQAVLNAKIPEYQTTAENIRKEAPALSFFSALDRQALETIPKMAAVTASGPAAPATAAAVFGFDEEGKFHPAQAAIAGALPFVGKYGGALAETLAEKLGVGNGAALSLINAGGRYASAQAVLIAQALPGWSKLDQNQKQEAVAGILVNSLLGLADFHGLRSDNGKVNLDAASREFKLASEKAQQGIKPIEDRLLQRSTSRGTFEKATIPPEIQAAAQVLPRAAAEVTKTQPKTEVSNAIQVKSPNESVLRPEEARVELPGVGARNLESQETAGARPEGSTPPSGTPPAPVRPAEAVGTSLEQRLANPDTFKGKDWTKDSYNYGADATPEQVAELTRLEQKYADEMKAIPKTMENLGKIGEIGKQKQWATEALRFRRAVEEAKSTGAKTDSELVAIAKKHGVGAGRGGDDAAYAKDLKEGLAREAPKEDAAPIVPPKTETPKGAEIPNETIGGETQTAETPINETQTPIVDRPVKKQGSIADVPASPLMHVEDEIGKIKLKSKFTGGYDYYDSEAYAKLQKLRPDLFSPTGSTPDQLVTALNDAGFGNVTTDNVFDTLLANHKQQAAIRSGNTPEGRADKFQKAIQTNATKPSTETVSVGEMGVGAKFKIGGEEFTVKKIDPDTGEVTVDDGRKFQRQYIPDGEMLPVDKGSHQPAAEGTFNPEPKEPAPKLAPGVNQGDLIASTQKEDLALVGEKGTNAERIAAEKSKAAQDAAEAKRIADEQQTELVGMGGAVPGEFTPNRQGATGIKNAAVDEARQARGEDPLLEPARLSNPVVWDRAMARIDADPAWQDRLINELREAPRTLTPEETIAMDHRYVTMQNEYAKTTRELAQAYDDSQTFPNRAEAIPELQARLAAQGDALYDFEQITQNVGTEWGRSGQIRQRLMNEDYSLARMTILKRAANEGRPLTDQETADIARLHDRIAELQQKVAAHEAGKTARESEAASKETVERIIKETAPLDPVIKRIVDRIGTALHTQRDAALARIKARGTRLTTGLDPIELADYTIVGASHLFDGALEFGKWSEKMVGDFTDAIKPHLADIFKASNAHFDKAIDAAAGKQASRVRKAVTVEESIGRAKDGIAQKIKDGKRTEITPLVQKLARLFVQKGVKERAALIDAVHDVIKEVAPEMTRRETMDAISGYGDFRLLSKDEVSVQLRDLKGQMQQVAKLEDMQAGVPPSKTGVQRRVPSAEERRLLKLVNDAKREFQIPVDNPETQLKSSLDELKKRMSTRIAELQDKLAKGDFSKKERRPIKQDAEAVRLTFQLDKAKREFHEALMQDRLARRSRAKKIFAGAAEVVNSARAILTSIDLSAVLRQGGFVALGHPLRAAKIFPDMLKAMVSKEQQHRVMQEIANRPNAPLYRSSKLYLSDQAGRLSQMEEAYMSRWAEKIPGVAASQRAYVTFLNRLRADSFDAMSASLSRGETPTPLEAKAIANFVNKATGRGSFGGTDTANVALNTVFFSPRYLASRFQLLAGQPLYGGTARTRKAVASEYARFLAGVGVVYTLGLVAGGKVEDDPRSSDFGKMRFGNSRVDPLTGLLQITTLLSRLGSGQTKNTHGKVVQIRDAGRKKVPFGGTTAMDILARFFRSKLSPSVGLGVDVATGKDFSGQKVTAGSVAARTLTPISAQDIYQAMKSEGVPEGTILGLLAIFGMGVQTYDDKKKPRQ